MLTGVGRLLCVTGNRNLMCEQGCASADMNDRGWIFFTLQKQKPVVGDMVKKDVVAFFLFFRRFLVYLNTADFHSQSVCLLGPS